MTDELEPHAKAVLAEMEDDARTMLRVADMLDMNRDTLARIASDKSARFTKSSAATLAIIVIDLVRAFAGEMLDAAARAEQVEVKAVMTPHSGEVH